MEKFNQKEYIKEFKKKNYKQFKVDLFNEDYEKLNLLLKEKNMSKADFVRTAKSLLEEGELKMKKCDDIVKYLKGKDIEVEFEDDFALGNYSEQSEEDTITLNDGYLMYILNKERTECFIDITKRTNQNDLDDESLEEYYQGYFSVETLENLLDLIK